MYSVGCSIDGTMSPMPAKWKTRSAPVNSGVAGLERADVALLEREPRLAGVVGKVRLAAADQIVDHPDAVAAREQQIDHVAADEAGAAGDDGDRAVAHAAWSFFMRRTL